VDTVYKVAEQVFIPLTVGGGISDSNLVRELLRSGADKVSINSPAVKDPSLIGRLADKFGSQCITVAVDARRNGERWEVVINGGRIPTGLDVIEWVQKAQDLGCGEILLTSMDTDGTRNGFDIPLLEAVTSCVRVPVIASGGAGAASHFSLAVKEGHASAVLAASLFHYGILSIQEVKEQMRKDGISVRTIARNEKI
jgi:cyclase